MPANKFAQVALVSAPNTGKSTLVNHILGGKVSIVSSRHHTTREQVLGILTKGDTQLVFLDTPGLTRKFKPERALTVALLDATLRAEIFLVIFDASHSMGELLQSAKDLKALIDKSLIDSGGDSDSRARKAELVIAVNKIDLCSRQKLLEMAKSISDAMDFSDAIHFISAKTGDACDSLVDELLARARVGKWHFGSSQKSNLSMEDRCNELLREALLSNLYGDLAFKCSSKVNSIEERAGGRRFVSMTIFTKKDRHKGIVLGAGGRTIKAIRQHFIVEARKILGAHCRASISVESQEKDKS